ncbi:MAG: PAS domain-containing sensor histidine kinase [Rhizobiales bacterium PAR1]|nr:MAG: PAS domain-containing sensor histidine kinase [Rhizobiales bacterium PAR1]
MAIETANRAAGSLLPAGMLDSAAQDALLANPMPGMLISHDGGRVLWSSHDVARRFGLMDGTGLMRAGLPVLAAGTQRLAMLARGLDADAPKRLERLRFNVGFRSLVLTALCEPLRLADGTQSLLVSLVEARPVRLNDGFGYEAGEALLPPRQITAQGDTATQDDSVAGREAELAEIAAGEPPDSSAPSAEPRIAPEWTDQPVESRHSLRFIFALDANGVVERVTPPLASAVGAGNADIVGHPLAGVVEAFDPSAAEAIRAAVAGGETWNGIAVRWPVAGTDLAIPIDLSALPLLTTERGLTGYSGFGRCHVARAEQVAQREAVIENTVAAKGDLVEGDLAEGDLAEADVPADAEEVFAPEAAALLNDAVAAQVAASDEAEPVTAQTTASSAVAATDVAMEPEVDAADAEPDLLTLLDPPASASKAEDVAIAGSEDTISEASEEDDAEADLDDETASDRLTPDTPVPDETAADTDMQEAAVVPVSEPVAMVTPQANNQNVVQLRAGQTGAAPGQQGKNGLSMAERNAFREIARALGAKFDPDSTEPPVAPSVGAQGSAEEPSRNEVPVLQPPAPEEAEPEPAVMTTHSGFTPMLPTAPQAAPLPVDTAAMPHEILDRLPIGMLVLKGDAALYANRTLLDLTGYQDFDDFVMHDGARAIFRKGTLPRDRESGFDTVVLAARDGEMIPVDAHLQIVDWHGEKATLISMRRAAELEQGKALRSVALDLKRVRAESQELRAVLDTATDGVITLDEKGRILSLNGAAEALFGLSQNEVAGESFTTLLLNESHADALDYFEGLQANGVRSVLNDGRDVYGREKKGGRIPLFMTLGRISDDEPRRYCAVLRDLTAWKRAEAELTDARRAAELASAKKSDFLAKISHEIRTPMNAIIGFAEVMMEERLGPVGSAKYKEYLGDIRTSGKHVVSLVNDLLDLAKIEAGRMEMNFAATDLNAIVSSSVGIIQPQANANRVLVRTQLAQKLPAVVADERSVRQIILNMLANATRFTESGGQVIVATALLDSGEAVIRIRDTGVGMSATEIEQALEPFRQVGTRRDQGGTGLGLPLTKALVEANRAAFSIRSTPGEGTMVEITFPSTRVLAE